MEMYKKASFLKLKIQTSRGLLTVDQLWDLKISELDALAVELEKQFDNSGGKSFVRKTSEKDQVAKLRFDITLDILTTKMEEENASRNAADVKAHNEKIDALIYKKQNEKLESMSVEELQKLRIQ